MAAERSTILQGEGPDGRLFAAVVPSARFVTGKPSGSRLSALLAPFQTDEAARAALAAAGALVIGE